MSSAVSAQDERRTSVIPFSFLLSFFSLVGAEDDGGVSTLNSKTPTVEPSSQYRTKVPSTPPSVRDEVRHASSRSITSATGWKEWGLANEAATGVSETRKPLGWSWGDIVLVRTVDAVWIHEEPVAGARHVETYEVIDKLNKAKTKA